MSILSSEWSNPQTFNIDTSVGNSNEDIADMTVSNMVKLYGSDEATYDQFSKSVAVTPDGTTVIVGAPLNIEAGIKSGSIYVFKKFESTFVEAQKLVKAAPNRKANEEFGFAIDVDGLGDRIVVSSPSCEPVGGMVTVFKLNNTGQLEEEASFHADDSIPNMGFGYSVAIDDAGSRIVVSAINGLNAQGLVTGAVYVFTRTGTTWAQEAKLVPTLATNKIGGTSVSISGDGLRCVIGNTGNDDGQIGTAYVFNRVGLVWHQEARIIPDTAGINFGISIDIDAFGTRMVIGANISENGQNPLVTTEGKAYIYLRNNGTWIKEAELIPVDGRAISKAGTSVSINADGSKVVIGAPETYYTLDSIEFASMGSAYSFKRTALVWEQSYVLKRKDSDLTSNRNKFGYSCAISDEGNIAVLGAYMDNDKGNQAGGVYVFQLNNSIDSVVLSENYLVTPGYDACANASPLAITTIGDNVVIGNPTDQGVDVNSGSMSIYSNLNDLWSLHAKVSGVNNAIANGHYEVGSLYGACVTISGNGVSVAILAPSDHAATAAISGTNPAGLINGAIYLYRLSGTNWVLQKVLYESLDYQLSGQMAFSYDGNVFAFSMLSATTGLNAVCSVYAYNGTTWAKKQDLSPAAGKPGSESRSIAISGDGKVIAIGFTASTKVHTFVDNGTQWVEAQLVSEAECPNTNHGFGRSVALSGDGSVLAIGASRTGLLPADANQGLVFIYKRTNLTWVKTSTLTGSLHHPANGFGESISISDNGARIVVGSPYEDQCNDGTNIVDCGVAYYFECVDAKWNELAILRRRNEVAAAKYGDNVAISGDGKYLLSASSRYGTVSIFKLK